MEFTLTKDTPPQEVFDYITDFLMAQGKRSVSYNMCSYRSANHCKCAVGAVIPDALYREAFEGKSIDGVLGELLDDDEFAALYDALYAHLLLLRTLQFVHDQVGANKTESELRVAWREGFVRAAHQYGLVYDPTKHNEQYQLK